MKKLLRILWKSTRFLLIGLLILYIGLMWALRSETVQDKLRPEIEKIVSNALKTKVTVGKMGVSFPFSAFLEDFRIYDKKDRPMIEVGEVNSSLISIPIFKMIFSRSTTKRFSFRRIKLYEPVVHIYRDKEDSTFNISLFTELGGGEPSTSGGTELDFQKIQLLNGSVTLIDYTRGDSLLQENSGHVDFGFLRIQKMFGDLGLEINSGGQIHGAIRQMTFTEARSGFELDGFSTVLDQYKSGDDHPGIALCLGQTKIISGKTEIHFGGYLDQDFHLDDTTYAPRLELSFQPSRLDIATLNYFMPGNLPLEGLVRFTGPVAGNLDTLSSDTFQLAFGEYSNLKMAFDLSGFTRSGGPKFTARFMPGIIQFEELDSLLAGTDLPLKGRMGLLGTLTGDLNRIKSNDLVIQYANRTAINVKMRLTDFTHPEGMIMDFRFAKSKAFIPEVRQLLSGYDLPAWLNNLGSVGMEGHFLGGIRDFVVDGTFDSNLGRVISNVHLVSPNQKPLEYSGWVDLKSFNLDKLGLVKSPVSNALNFSGKVNGKGTDIRTMNTEVSGKIERSQLVGYQVDYLGTDKVTLRNDSIFGEINLQDEQGNASLDLVLDFSDTTQHFNLFGDIAEVDLLHYGVSTVPMRLSSVLNIRIDGDSLENYTGRAKFFSLLLDKPDKGDTLEIHDLRLYSRENSIDSKNLELKSSLCTFDFRSNLSFKRGQSLFERLIKEAKLYIQNNDSALTEYYSNIVLPESNDSVHFNFTSKEELNDAAKFFELPVYLENETTVAGNFESGELETVKLKVHFDSLAFNGMGMPGDSATFELTKSATSNVLVAVANLDVHKFYVTDGLTFGDVHYEAQFSEEEVEHYLFARQKDLENEYNLHAKTRFLKDSIITQLRTGDSRIRINDEDWLVSSENRILKFEDEIFIEKLEFKNDLQSIFINGTLSKREEDMLAVLIRNFQFSSLKQIFETESPIDGEISMLSVKILQGLGKPQVQFVGRILDFEYDEIDSVTVDVQGGWSGGNGPGLLGLATTWQYRDHTALEANGYYDIKNDFLRFSSKNSRLPLPWISPFVKGILSDVEGELVVDDFSIRGKIRAPRMNGKLHFENAGMRVDYLDNMFYFDDGGFVSFNNQRIGLDSLILMDTLGHKAPLAGAVYLNNLDSIGLDIRIPKMENFLFMNTRKQPESVFYGRVVVSTLDTVVISGTAKKIGVAASVKTGPGSWLDIPISDYSSQARLDFVTFYNQGKQEEIKEKSIDLTGFLLDLNVEPTPDARVRLIFDEQVGDIIEAYGSGAINMVITDKGEFAMRGYYEVDRGDYMFTAQNIVNKKFNIDKGGRITWTGDPYEADLDIAAVYKVKADASDILGGNGSGGKIPVEIVMIMKGSLLKPVIDLQLRLDQLHSEDVAGLASYFRNIQYDEQELNRQVVSLLIFRRFAPKSSYYAGGGSGGGVTSSISELISNQLNYWLSQAFDSNIGVELNTNDFDEVELALRASFFNDKVTVERNGTIVGNRTGQVSIGDISVLVKLLPSTPKDDENGNGPLPRQGQGQLVLEIFNRENFTLTNANSNTTGAGIFYKKDFDRLVELFQNQSKGRKEEDLN